MVICVIESALSAILLNKNLSLISDHIKFIYYLGHLYVTRYSNRKTERTEENIEKMWKGGELNPNFIIIQ